MIGLSIIYVQVMELEISWPSNGRRSVFFIVFVPSLHLRCVSHIDAIVNTFPQIYVGTEVITEVACRLLHFLIVIALSTVTVAVVCSALTSVMCATSALLASCSPRWLASRLPP
jgi:hypothetical protein